MGRRGSRVEGNPVRGNSMDEGPEVRDSMAYPGYYKQFSKANVG